jgi:hypothetical protein
MEIDSENQWLRKTHLNQDSFLAPLRTFQLFLSILGEESKHIHTHTHTHTHTRIHTQLCFNFLNWGKMNGDIIGFRTHSHPRNLNVKCKI